MKEHQVQSTVEDDAGEKYFDSYEDLKVHKLMLDDHCRTEAYKNAIFSNKKYFKDKTVMDVGAGTGILALFCAAAGAKKVYAVEASGIAKLITEVAEENNLSHVIEVHHSRVEDITLEDEQKVDIIVSEWMGFYLLHEGMLDSVLIARDRFLKPDGKIFPEEAELWISPCSLPQFFDYWSDVHGFSMSAFGREMRKVKSNQPEITDVTSQDLLAEPSLVCKIDLSSVARSELDKRCCKCVVPVTKKGTYQGLCMWFTCVFPMVDAEVTPVILSTSPHEPSTHWKQTVVVFPTGFAVEENDLLAWELSLERSSENARQYNMQVTLLDPENETHPVPCPCKQPKCMVIRAYLKECDERDAANESDGEGQENKEDLSVVP